MINFRAELNQEQYSAVTHEGSPALVLAGAGSGKTRTLIYRVAWLLDRGVEPEAILLLTFTNKAANEMLERVRNLLQLNHKSILGGTFHAFGNYLLRQQPELFGLSPNFTILDRDDQEKLIGSVLSRYLKNKPANFPKPPVIAEIFSLATNSNRDLVDVINKKFAKFKVFSFELIELEKKYQNAKLESNCVDFDDLLVKPLEQLQKNKEFAHKQQNRFKHILVDEYQDTNKIQASLVTELNKIHNGLMAVGDDAQSIYSWRGAEYRNILDFQKQFPDAKVFKIETNYRSAPLVLEVANQAIKDNKNRLQKKLIPARKYSSTKPQIIYFADSASQADFVVNKISEFLRRGINGSEIAVLYRSHFLSQEVELTLQRAQIPYRITSGLRFFEQAHIKDVLAWMRFATNPRDEVSFMRIVGMLDGVGPKSAAQLWEKTRNLLNDNQNLRNLKNMSGVAPKIKTSWEKMVDVLIQVSPFIKPTPPSKMLETILKNGYQSYVESTYSNASSRLEEIELLAEFAGNFPTVDAFLSQLALLSNVDATPDQDANIPKVTLSTIHQAKGLEWKVVFLIWLVENVFPSRHSVEEEEAIEEERRLFYVAITRCKDYLFLTVPRLSSQGFVMKPSRFLNSIPESLVQIHNNFNSSYSNSEWGEYWH
ncbi:MAG: ATP-dependent helicase [Chthoniobacterales bacterium]|nr:ATP-dependent helicase [Chthoniobacterales bacterium]